jgi:hypothetical protein
MRRTMGMLDGEALALCTPGIWLERVWKERNALRVRVLTGWFCVLLVNP